MKIVLTEQESEQYFFDAMCNGLNELAYYDLELDYNENEFSDTKHKLGVASPGIMICYEDILMEMLREGKSLWIVGCKQWHLGNSLRNKYKHKFEKIAKSIPDYSSIIL
jgi:hypothetical protein